MTVEEYIDARDQGAIFSPCRRWRYLLWRRWDRQGDVLMVVGLNPSTANETEDDPTIRRCIGFAKGWGFGALWMVNAYAFRATQPRDMIAQGSGALGPRNNEFLLRTAIDADMVLAAWGTHCDGLRESQIIGTVTEGALKPLYAFGFTKGGHPKHPLYLRADTKPMEWHGIARRSA